MGWNRDTGGSKAQPGSGVRKVDSKKEDSRRKLLESQLDSLVFRESVQNREDYFSPHYTPRTRKCQAEIRGSRYDNVCDTKERAERELINVPTDAALRLTTTPARVERDAFPEKEWYEYRRKGCAVWMPRSDRGDRRSDRVGHRSQLGKDQIRA